MQVTTFDVLIIWKSKMKNINFLTSFYIIKRINAMNWNIGPDFV